MHDELRERDVERVVGERQPFGGPGRTSTSGKRARVAATKESDGSIAQTAPAPEALDQFRGQRSWPAPDIERSLALPHACLVGKLDSQRLEKRPMNRA